MPVAFHFSWNMIQALMGLSVSGLSLFPGTAMFKVEMAGSALLTGGDFGLENSLPVIFLLLAISFFLISRIRNSIGKDTGKGVVSVSAIL